MAYDPKGASWFLDGYTDGERFPRRYAIDAFPFRIGRNTELEASLPVYHVSALHAEIYLRDGILWLRDHHSSNGTFLNRERVTEDVPLREGDIVHFATSEFVLSLEPEAMAEHMETMCLTNGAAMLPKRLVSGAPQLRELLERQCVIPHFQPIVPLHKISAIFGFEVLGRGAHEGLPMSPGELFQIAESAGLEVALSVLFRRTGLETAPGLPGRPRIFVNSHPSEMNAAELMSSLREIREAMPDLCITLETHEKAVQDHASMKELRAALTELDIGLAYDDFGAGQARLVELVEVPPDVLKFDISLVRDIDRATPARRKMLGTLVTMVRDMDIACLAEGIEREEELAVCRELGFDYAQGYLLGRPAPLHTWLEAEPEELEKTAAVVE